MASTVDPSTRLTPGEHTQDRRREWWWGGAIVLALTALFAAANWHWLSAAVVTYGWDRMDHLITSLVYNDMVAGWFARTPFDLLSYSTYYPPLFHYSIVALYRIFGVSEDVAAMVNVFYLALLLGATYAIARRMAGRWTAALATFLIGMFPMIFAMSRYLYIDFALTGMVAFVLAMLLATERFSRRGMSLALGAALGASLLLKWTSVAFVAAPLIYLVLRSGMLAALAARPRLLVPDLRNLLLALLAAAAVNLLWLLPAREVIAATWLGWGLLSLLTITLAGALYALFAVRPAADDRSRALKNALGGGAVAAWLVSLWYGINPEFVDHFAFTAYGRDEPFMAFGKYFREVTTEQAGIFFTLLFFAVGGVWLWQNRAAARAFPKTGRDGKESIALRPSFGDTAWVLLLWVIVPYFIFSFRVTLAHSRFVMPFLPPFAIWIAVGMARWRPPWLRATAIGVTILVACLQFAVITFDELAGWRAPFVVPLAGQPVNLLGSGFFIQFPASERTDPGFAVAPAALAIADKARQAQGRETIHFGLLVNSYQLHEKHFLYQIYKYFPQVRLRELARNWRDQAAYNQLFDMDYVLVSDTHDFRTDEPSQEAAARILFDPADAFNRAFAPVRAWTMPNGETVTLYTRRFAPTEPGVANEEMLALLTLFGDRLGHGDAVVLTAPDQVDLLGLALPADAGATIVPLPAPGATRAETEARLAELAETHARIFLVSHNADQADPDGAIEGWLRDNTVAANDLWANSIRVTPLAPVSKAVTALDVNAAWPDGLQLKSVATRATARSRTVTAGGALVVALEWAGQGEGQRKVSLQLLSPDGVLAAQEDRDVVDGAQQFVLLVPRSAAPGDYRLTLAIYDPATLARHPTTAGGETVILGVVAVEPSPTVPAPTLPALRHPNAEDEEGN